MTAPSGSSGNLPSGASSTGMDCSRLRALRGSFDEADGWFISRNGAPVFIDKLRWGTSAGPGQKSLDAIWDSCLNCGGRLFHQHGKRRCLRCGHIIG